MPWARSFHRQSGSLVPFDDGAAMALLAALINGNGSTVILGGRGFIGGTIAPAYFNHDWKMAVELFWWAEGGGLELLRAFESWAMENGANEVRMTSLADLPRADDLLCRKGYKPTEISYQKVM